MKTSELIKILKREGCYKERSGSNHDVWFSLKMAKDSSCQGMERRK